MNCRTRLLNSKYCEHIPITSHTFIIIVPRHMHAYAKLTNSIHSKQSHHSLWIHAWDKFPYHHMQVILKQINSIINSHSFKTKEHKQKVPFIGFQLFKNHANITLQFSVSAWNCIGRVMTITVYTYIMQLCLYSTAMFSFCSFFFTQLLSFKRIFQPFPISFLQKFRARL